MKKQRQSRKIEIKPKKFFDLIREQKIDKIKAVIRGIDFQIPSNNLALFIAAYLGNTDIVQLLISHKADLNCHFPNDLHLSHLHGKKVTTSLQSCAGSFYRIEVVTETQLGESATPLMAGIHSTNPQIIPLLVRAKANINACNSSGLSPLSLSVHQELADSMKILLELKADPIHYEQGDPFTLIHLAAAVNKNTQIVQILLDLKADINDTQNIYRRTPMHGLFLSENKSNLKMIKFLLDHKADVNIRSSDGDRPIDYLISAADLDTQTEDLESDAQLMHQGKQTITFLLNKFKPDIKKLKSLNELALNLRENFNKGEPSQEIKAMDSEVEKLINIIRKSEEIMNAELKNFGMDLKQLKKNNINPVIPKTWESFGPSAANLEKSLASFTKNEPILNKRLSNIKLKWQKINESQQKLLQEKFEAQLESKRKVSRNALSPLVQWHLREQWRILSHNFNVHYKIFWKLSEKYSRVRQQLITHQDSAPTLDFASLEKEVQQIHKQQSSHAPATLPVAGDFKKTENRIDIIQKKTLQLEQMQRRFCKSLSMKIKPVKTTTPEEKIPPRDSQPKKSRTFKSSVMVSLPKVPAVKKIHHTRLPQTAPSFSVESRYYSDSKELKHPDLSDVIIAVDQITELKNTVARIVQMGDELKGGDDTEISLLALLGVIVRFNSMLQSMPQLISASAHFSSDAGKTLNEIRNALFVLTSSLDHIKNLSIQSIQGLGVALKDLMTAFALKIGGRAISAEELTKRLDNFTTLSSLLIASTQSFCTAKTRQDYCKKMLNIIMAKLSYSPESAVMEMLFNALMFVGGLVGKIKTQEDQTVQISTLAKGSYSVLAQARHQAFPDYPRIMDAIVSLMSLGEFDVDDKFESSGCRSASSSSTASSINFSFAESTASGPALFSSSSGSSRTDGVRTSVAPSSQLTQPG